METIKKGDVVQINDFSYSQKVEDGKLSRYWYWNKAGVVEATAEIYIVVETGCSIPTTSSIGESMSNNTIIQSADDGSVVFIQARFLRSAAHHIQIDGKDICISHESYQNLKKSLGE